MEEINIINEIAVVTELIRCSVSYIGGVFGTVIMFGESYEDFIMEAENY